MTLENVMGGERMRYVDRRKQVFDRRKRSNWFLSVVRCWWLGSLDRVVLGKSRKGEERRQVGERREDWIRYSPYCSTYCPVRGPMVDKL